MNVLVTGAAGFIGFSLVRQLLAANYSVFGIDNLSKDTDLELAAARQAQLVGRSGYRFEVLNILDRDSVRRVLEGFCPDCVVHLAAKVRARGSLGDSQSYFENNVLGFDIMLEECRKASVRHFVYASSSSVYGINSSTPFRESDKTESPISIYAVTKKANELSAHVYSHLQGLRTTGLRFFTVYGPWGRPDMVPFKFTKNILEGREIEIFGDGKQLRDFTYISDAVNAIQSVIDHGRYAGGAAFQVFNIGSAKVNTLNSLVDQIESCTGKAACRKNCPANIEDVRDTAADVSRFREVFGWQPEIGIDTGIPEFVEWYRQHFCV